MKGVIAFVSILLFLFFGCIPDDEQGINMEFAETQCANPWDALPGAENYLSEVKSYLEKQGITVWTITSIGANISAGATCAACICQSGRKIIIRIPGSDQPLAESVGFKPPSN